MRHANDEYDFPDEDDPLARRQGRSASPVRSGPRRWPRILLGFLFFIVILAWALPRLASIAPIRRIILNKINASMPSGSLAVDDWSLRWFSPVTMSGLHFEDPTHGLHAQVVTLTTTRGLAGLIPMGRINAGTVTLDAPQIVFGISSTQAPSATTAESAAKPHSLPVNDLCVKIVVEGGRLQLNGVGEKPFVMEHIGLTTDIRSLRSPIPVDLAAFVPWGDDAGRIVLSGTMPPSAFFLSGTEATTEHLALNVMQLDLQSLRGLLERVSGKAWIHSGVMDGKILLDYQGFENARLQTTLSVKNMSIDPPDNRPASPAGDIHLQADLSYADGRLSIGSCSLVSPWTNMRANGQWAIQADDHGRRMGGVEVQMDANMAAIMRDFGNVLKQPNRFLVERGTLYLNAVLSGTTEAMDAKLVVTSSNLTMRSGSQHILLQPPPSVSINVSRPYGQPFTVRELAIDLPFAKVTGKGRVDQADINASVDLAAMSGCIQALVTNLPPMSGVLSATVKTHADAARMTADALLTMSGVSVDCGPRTGRLNFNQARLTLSAKEPLPEADVLPPMEFSDVTIAFESDAGNISGTATRFIPPTGGKPLIVSGGLVKTELDLREAQRMLAPLLTGILPPSAVAKGKLMANFAVETAGGQTKVRVNTVAQEFQLTTFAWDVRERDIRIKVAVDADTNKSMLRVFDTHVGSDLLTLDVPDWQMQYADDALDMKGSADGALDLAALSSWQRAGKDGKAPSQIKGRLTFHAQGGTDKNNIALALNAALNQFSVAAENNSPFVEPHAEVVLKADIPTDASRLNINAMSLKTSLVSLDASGKINDPLSRCVVDIKGSWAVDFDAVTAFLRAQGVQNLALSGKQTRAFAINGPAGAGVQSLLSYGKGNASLYIGSAAAFGLSASASDASLVLTDGVAHFGYEPAIGAGRIRLLPSTEVTCTPMVLSIPARTMVLKDVPLTQEMLDQALVMLIPLLRGCTVMSGTVDLTVQECHIPLGPTASRDMTFALGLALHNLQLVPGGTLATLLQLAGLNGQTLTVKDYDMTAECKNGRIRPSPLTLSIAGVKVQMIGTVGVDQTLAFTVVVPLSKGLVGKEAAKYIEGAVINVPITGTIKSPAIDRATLDAEIKRLIFDAGKKAAMESLGGFLNSLNNKP